MRNLKILGALAIAIVAAFSLTANSVLAKERTKGRGAPGQPEIYVYSQGLVYDSIVLGDLPFNGTDNFQLLEMGGPTGLQTEFGPGDTGYYGGRWWIDANEDGYMDDEDIFFLCPLLGPGEELY
jgi:hypothetical protein